MNKTELEAEVSRLKIENKILQETMVMMGDRTQIQYIPYPAYPQQPYWPTPHWYSSTTVGIGGYGGTQCSISDGSTASLVN